jgi:hypothetical protein
MVGEIITVALEIAVTASSATVSKIFFIVVFLSPLLDRTPSYQKFLAGGR